MPPAVQQQQQQQPFGGKRSESAPEPTKSAAQPGRAHLGARMLGRARSPGASSPPTQAAGGRATCRVPARARPAGEARGAGIAGREAEKAAALVGARAGAQGARGRREARLRRPPSGSGPGQARGASFLPSFPAGPSPARPYSPSRAVPISWSSSARIWAWADMAARSLRWR